MKLLAVVIFCCVQVCEYPFKISNGTFIKLLTFRKVLLCTSSEIPKLEKTAGTKAEFDEIRATQARAREVAANRETVTNTFRRMSMESLGNQMNTILDDFIGSHEELRYIYTYIKDFGIDQEQSTCIDDLLFENEYIAFVYETEFTMCTSQFEAEYTNATQTYNNMLEQSIRRGTVAMQALTITEISKTTGFIREPTNAVNYFNERLYRYIGDWNSYYAILLQTGLTRMQDHINDAGQTVDTCMRIVVDHMNSLGEDIMQRMNHCEPDA